MRVAQFVHELLPERGAALFEQLGSVASRELGAGSKGGGAGGQAQDAAFPVFFEQCKPSCKVDMP